MPLHSLAAALFLQTVAAPPPDRVTSERRAARRVPVTAEHLATAYRDTAARTLVARARRARLAQDSSLVSYDAVVTQRLSVHGNLARIARNRLVMRIENASRVRWHRDRGAMVDVLGHRAAMPGIPRKGREAAEREMHEEAGDLASLPYHPGLETLWIGAGMVQADVDETDLVHPLANGAEAYYTYRSGDSASLRLPDGREVRLRELEVRPRRTSWNVVVGSLWFDEDRGQLVRGAYRFGEPLDIWARVREENAADRAEGQDEDDPPAWVTGVLSPMKGQITGIAVEYGLHEGRFWLPRLQSVEGDGQVAFMRVPFSMQHRFRYEKVNDDALADSIPVVASLPGAPLRPPAELADSLKGRWRDSVRTVGRDAWTARRDSIEKGLVKVVAPCDTGTTRTVMETRGNGRIPVLARVPCDAVALARSSELPPSIYAEGEEAFDSEEARVLLEQAIDMGAQPAGGVQPPTFAYGLRFVRYNRIEGLSVGIRADQTFGAGYTADATVRLGLADLEPNADLGIARSDLSRTIRLGAYNRLVSSSDWGDPFSLGASVNALVFGRDDGFYHRASGVELTGTMTARRPFAWRAFVEQQRAARTGTDFYLVRPIRDRDFTANIEADRGVWSGLSLFAARTIGHDPRGLRLFTVGRVEGAGGETHFGRGSIELTLSRAFGPADHDVPMGALTVAAGSSIGDVPVQRRWYLGGTQTVRGHAPGIAHGDAFWFGRAEIGHEIVVGRASLFGDLGWAGERADFTHVGRPVSGAGAGWSFMEGLVRLDVARGIHPVARWRMDLSLEARF